jgi:hypothetical protein
MPARGVRNKALSKSVDNAAVDSSSRVDAMASFALDSNRLLLSDGSGDGRAGVDLQALSPILIGFMCPFVVLLLIDPAALRHVQFAAILVLILGFVLSATVFVHATLTPGRTTAIAFDAQARIATITRRGAFASRRRSVAFADIQSLELATAYDDDGYPTRTPELHLASGEVIELPAGTQEADLDAVGRMLGFA